MFTVGQAHGSDGVVLHWAANGSDACRYAVAAKTSTGNAVVRNRVRRWGRELLRQWQQALLPGYDLILIARGRDAARCYADFAYHLRRVLDKAQLLADSPMT
ncbi:ribonuclease P protein component [bacterium]|nr:ribonuclease P protein component [bacterium]